MSSCSAETHLFSSHPTIDASEASVSRAWGPCRPVSPKDPIKASHETRNRPEECLGSTMAGRPRALFVTKRHKTSRFGHFARHFRDRVQLFKKKVPVGVRLISTRRRPPTNFLPHKCPWSRDQKPRPGVSARTAGGTAAPTRAISARSSAACFNGQIVRCLLHVITNANASFIRRVWRATAAAARARRTASR